MNRKTIKQEALKNFLKTKIKFNICLKIPTNNRFFFKQKK